MKKIFMLLFLVIGLGFTLNAQPSTINYQGKLLDADALPVNNATTNMTFAIYSAESAGTKLWPVGTSSVAKVVNISRGLYSVSLGTGVGTDEAFTSSMFSGQTPYLEVTVNSTVLPRTAIQNVPFALISNQLNTSGWASPGAIGGTSANTASFTTLNTSQDATINGIKVGKGNSSVSSNTAVGSSSMTANTTGINNTAIGFNSLNTNTTGNHNTALGRGTLLANTSGSNNTAVGRNALTSSNSDNNTALGYFALNANTTGTNNVSTGMYSARFNTSGSNNTSDGYMALYNNTTGSYNSASGTTALSTNTTGSNNTAMGSAALEKSTADNNTAFGFQANYGTTTGDKNTSIGVSTFYKNTTGTGNVAIGYQAGFGDGNDGQWSITDNYATFVGFQASRDQSIPNTTSLTNITAIGKNAKVATSNSIVLGGTGSDLVKVGIGTASPSERLDVVGSVKIVDGTQGAGKVLTSDANGKASWQTPSGGGSGVTYRQAVFTNEAFNLTGSPYGVRRTYTVSGASVGDAVIANLEGISATGNYTLSVYAWVSAANTVTLNIGDTNANLNESITVRLTVISINN
jgi:hypothetical protein